MAFSSYFDKKRQVAPPRENFSFFHLDTQQKRYYNKYNLYLCAYARRAWDLF